VVLTNSGSNAPVSLLSLELAERAVETFAAEPEPWRPLGPAPQELQGVLGRWWSEGDELVLRLKGEELQLVSVAAPDDPPAVLRREGEDRYRGVSGRERGELLLVERDADGAVVQLWWATYPLTREPLIYGG
jgi:hypothetical protein